MSERECDRATERPSTVQKRIIVTQAGFPEIPLKRGNDYLFLCLKEKGRKRSRQPCRLTAYAHQLSRTIFFCFQRCCASDGGFTYTRSKEVGICRLTNGRFRFDGRGACPSSYREPRNTNRMGLRSTIRGDFDQMDAGVRRRGSISPHSRICSRWSPSADGTKPLSG